VKIYDAFAIVPPLNKSMRFDDSYLSKESLENMKEWGVSACTLQDDNGEAKPCRDIDTVTDADTVIPIRITMDITGNDFSDDWTVASPIIELDFSPINRWWPREWFIDDNGQPFNNVRINYKGIVLNLKYIEVDANIVDESFIDVITPTDDLLNDNKCLMQDQIKVKEGDNNMFGKNKNIEVEGQIQSEETEETKEVTEVPETEEIETSTATEITKVEEEVPDVNDIEVTSATEEKHVQKISKKTKGFIVGGGAAAVVATVATILIILRNKQKV